MAKPAPKRDPKPELVYELEGAPPQLFVVFDLNGSWKTVEGWTTQFTRAGTFTEERARALAEDRFTVVPLRDLVREHVVGANPIVLQAIAALGGR